MLFRRRKKMAEHNKNVLTRIRLPVCIIRAHFFLHDCVMLYGLEALDTFGNCQRPVSQKYAQNDKPVKILTQLVVEVARE